MTLITITDTEIRAYNHVGKTGVCIAISAVLQTAARILNKGMALDECILDIEPPRLEIKAAVGDFLGGDAPISEQLIVMRQRSGREAFVKAVFDGVKATLEEIAQLNAPASGIEPLLEIKDTREMRDRPSAKSRT